MCLLCRAAKAKEVAERERRATLLKAEKASAIINMEETFCWVSKLKRMHVVVYCNVSRVSVFTGGSFIMCYKLVGHFACFLQKRK